MADLIPGGRIGRYLSLRSAISAGTFLVSFYLLGYILDNYKVGVFSGFPLVYMITLAGCLGSLLMYFLIHAPVPLGEGEEPALGLKAFFREAKQNDIGMFIVYSTLVILTASISGAFFSVYMLQDLHFTYLTFTIIISVEFLARIVSLSFWGKMVDSVGAIKVLRLASILIPVIPCLWLFSSNIAYLMAVQCLSGLSWAAYDLCIQSYICGASPRPSACTTSYTTGVLSPRRRPLVRWRFILLNVRSRCSKLILGFLIVRDITYGGVIAVLQHEDTGANSRVFHRSTRDRESVQPEDRAPETQGIYNQVRALQSLPGEGRQRDARATAPIAFKDPERSEVAHLITTRNCFES
jgi:hypothetical protein